MRIQSQGLVKAAPVSPIALVQKGLLQRKCNCGGAPDLTGECAECSTKRLTVQRKAANQADPFNAPPVVHEVLRSSGQPLHPQTRAFMEPRFSHDFGGVRVHTDAKAAESALAVNALAYTTGQDIVFGAGQYSPGSKAGDALLAHELTHVVQQKASGSASVQHQLAGEQPGDPMEREADRMADSVTGASPLHNKENAFLGQSLPYREATELAECIRIMGDAQYCREVVLGEKPSTGCDLTSLQNPLSDFSTFQSPGASGWWGARFGCYRNSCTKPHKGWDIHAAAGTPVIAAVTGSVTHHQNPGGWGDYIKLKSQADPTRVYLYGHLSQRQPAQTYCVGDTIGQTGTSGNAQADRPHLHFEVQSNGNAVDPATYFTEPTNVVEASGSSATVIDKTIAAACNPKC